MGQNGGDKNWFRVVGLVTNPYFQKCRYIVERLTKSYPKIYRQPDIRPMLNVDWTEYFNKVKRKIGGRLFELTKPVAVFLNGKYLGDDEDLYKYIATTYRFSVTKNFEQAGVEHLDKVLQGHLNKGRQFAYLCIAIEGKVIGSLLFILYADMLPVTCANFLRRCNKKRNGYLGTVVHRIAKPSWVQAGGYWLKERRMPCENYTVPHDRRGVLSMANAGRHKENSTQFHIALNPSPWMDYRYVAFGQLLQGEEILQQIEEVPTSYESPLKKIQIVKCGEFTLDTDMQVSQEDMDDLEKYFERVETIEKSKSADAPKDMVDARDVDSFIHESRLKEGLYYLDSDLKSYFPFLHLPDYLILSLLREQEGCDEGTDFMYSRELLMEQLEQLREGQIEHVTSLIKMRSEHRKSDKNLLFQVPEEEEQHQEEIKEASPLQIVESILESTLNLAVSSGFRKQSLRMSESARHSRSDRKSITSEMSRKSILKNKTESNDRNSVVGQLFGAMKT